MKIVNKNTLKNMLNHLQPLSKAELEIFDVEIIEEKQINDKAFAKANIEKQPDLLYVKFKLVHEGTNKNKDGFKKDDLVKAEKTPINKALNWEHGEPVIGVIYASKFVDPSVSEAEGASSKGSKDGKAHIVCEAAIWKFRNPDIAEKIVNRYKNQSLAFSMEAYYGGVECSVCGAYFKSDEHGEGTYCEHLNNRFETAQAADGSQITRYLRDFIFGAAGVVENPADVDAEALALASNKTQREEVSTLDKFEMTKAELDAKIKEAVDTALAEAEGAADLEALTSERDELKVSNEALVKERDQLKTDLETASKERDQVKSDFDSFKSQLETEKVQLDRLNQLTEAGVSIPDDDAAKAKFIGTIMSMNDEAFALHVESIKSISKASNDKETSTEREVPAKGSVKASASTNEKKTAAERVAAFFESH